ncbi:preprotein translocase [Klebsiella sp. A-Nf5]|uniref:tyrosine-type recombinase/integrase n=1 Tax=unclassified Klebsiella TaxID=2608929 RepID=UPI000C29CFCC|nr:MULTISPECIES: integrase family protein [unclassified Klebsiella]PJX30209.1 preprotein translocase [Klebsiella sp. A-Nf5]PJX39707.1 preprotein translocase [Klebsiella sp. B-Nf7]PJX50466.1 preprotein translocase [Klebsiella sp. C1-16S-Nf17]
MSNSNRIKLTTSVIDKAKADANKAQTFYWDSEVPGLGLRITATGDKAFIFQSRVHGKSLRITIGSVKVWRLDGPADSSENNARKEARRLQALCDTGIDPREAKEERRQAAEEKFRQAERETTTLQVAWSAYIEHLKTTRSPKTGKLRSPRYITDHFNLSTPGGKSKTRGKGKTVAGPLASLMPLRLKELNAAKLAEWLQYESNERPSVAAHAYRLLRAFLSWLEQSPWSGLADKNVCQSHEVKEHLARAETKDDCLQREQLANWFAAVQQLSNQTISNYLQILLLTGARREELANLKWNDIDFKWHSMTIRDKIEGERVIPLTPYVSMLAHSLPRQKLNDGITDNPYVFASARSTDGRIKEPRLAHNRALENAGLPHISLHGLRRSFGTLSEWIEVPVGIVAQIMGHKPSALAEKHYRRRPIDLLRKWHTKIEEWVLEQAGILFVTPEKEKTHIRLVENS